MNEKFCDDVRKMKKSFFYFFVCVIWKKKFSKNLNEKNVRLNEYKKKLNFQHFEKQIAISIKNLKIDSIIFSKIKIFFKCYLSKLFYLKSLFSARTSISFIFSWIEKFAIKIFFANSNENLNDNENLFDRTFICSNFSLIMNFVVFDTNKFNEKFQFFVSVVEKKFEFFDMHRKFSKNSDFDNEIENVATTKIKKDFGLRDLINRKLIKLLKTFFFILKKHHFSLKKMFSIFETFMTSYALSMKSSKKIKLNVCINVVILLYFYLFKALRSKTIWNEKKYASFCVKNIKIRILFNELLFSAIWKY